MEDLFGTKIVRASREEPAQHILDRAGVNTINGFSQTYLEYNGKKIVRPMINRWEAVVLAEFNILIEYTDKEEVT